MVGERAFKRSSYSGISRISRRSTVQELIDAELLPAAKASGDLWSVSALLHLAGRPVDALRVLVEAAPLDGEMSACARGWADCAADPVFLDYLLHCAASPEASVLPGRQLAGAIAHLAVQTTYTLDRAGLPLFALETLTLASRYRAGLGRLAGFCMSRMLALLSCPCRQLAQFWRTEPGQAHRTGLRRARRRTCWARCWSPPARAWPWRASRACSKTAPRTLRSSATMPRRPAGRLATACSAAGTATGRRRCAHMGWMASRRKNDWRNKAQPDLPERALKTFMMIIQ